MDEVTPCRYGAPCVLIVAYDKTNVFTYPGEARDSGIEDASIVATHLCLAATNAGVDNCWLNFFDPKKENRGLPWFCVQPNSAYILLDKDGEFYQLWQYGEDRSPKFDVDFHVKTSKGDNEKIPHIHEYVNDRRQHGRPLSDSEYDKYSKFFERK